MYSLTHPKMYQVLMLNTQSGFVINYSNIFTREEDLQWYMYLMTPFLDKFKFIVYYQFYESNRPYQYQYQQGSYEYLSSMNFNTTGFNFDSTAQENINEENTEYEVPPVFEERINQDLPSYQDSNFNFTEYYQQNVNQQPKENLDDNNNIISNKVETSKPIANTSGFNFHFDPPTNLNMVVNPEVNNTEVINQDNIQENLTDNNVYDNSLDSSFMVYPEEYQNEEENRNESNLVFIPNEDEIVELLEQIEDSEENPPLATSTPPPIEDDYWDVLDEENKFTDMKLYKFGRGYLLKCEPEHPDYGIKYYPSQENCLAWWQPTNEGWFIRRENKNYFLEKGAQFIHRRSKRVRS